MRFWLAALACLLAMLAQGNSERPYRLTTVAEGLSFPWCIAFLPNGDLLVTERTGALRLVRDGALEAQPIAGVPPVYVRSQGGLFDVALHPDFDANGWLYLSYAHGDANGNATRLAGPGSTACNSRTCSPSSQWNRTSGHRCTTAVASRSCRTARCC